MKPDNSQFLASAGNFFVGAQGLRAGWRFSLYVLVVAATIFGLTIYAHHGHRQHGTVFWEFFRGEAILSLVAFIPAFIMSLYEKRPFAAYGLPARAAFGKLFWSGVVWGVIAFSLLMFALRILGAFYFGNLAIHGLSILKYGAFYALLFLLVGMTEEFMFRGYSQFTLAQGIGFWPAGIAISVLFGLVHLGNKGEDLIGAAGVVMIGLFFCLTLRRTGNLWFAVGIHGAWDWAESFVYSVADSGRMTPGHLLNSTFHGSKWLNGGTVGPEGSILVFVLIPAMCFLFARMHPGKDYRE